ncbi:ABC transporter permease [Bifidobacterium biavatii]|uniref:Dipeptide/oligopeptide/nickel ABC transporter permease n=1 Tax=Bifidobacterium biavatii DSM 23969 TaxID=1437608 RepID=A0A087A1S2_9BIFI|nr:ABC transporter permease [Bifidobacterium biavatii]KFI52722.1 dipeptide/oligopeptide/nickel ABC transporter permease [Bifidobacterium biavatii DSM 23969]
MFQRFILPTLKRLVTLIPVALGVCLLTFLLLHVAPGDPVRLALGDKASAEAIATRRHEWGLDKPLWVQFLDFVVGIFHGDLGDSITLNEPTATAIAQRLPPTLLLMAGGTLIGIVLALPLAILSTKKIGGFFDEFMRVFVALLQGIPSFVLGTFVIILFGLQLKWMPVGGYGTTLMDHLVSIVLPSITIGIGLIPVLFRGFRQAILDSLESDSVAFGKAKGLPDGLLKRDYVIRPAAVDTVNLIGLQLGSLVGGVVIVENVFAIPGMGNLMMSAILSRDFPLVQGVVIVFAALVTVIYLLTDICYTALDPRGSMS